MTEAYTFNRAAFLKNVDALRGCGVLLVGDIMLDEYLEGDAERISPEAPIPIVKVSQSRILLGGAGNVARNIMSLNGHVRLIGICGADAKGDILQEILEQECVAASIIQSTNRPTTLKTRVIARNQQMLRIDREEIAPLQESEIASILGSIHKNIDKFTVLVISDYGKGVVSPGLMRGILALRDASSSKPRILVDPKTPNFPLYKDVHILTPNAKETSEGVNMPTGSRAELLAAGKAIFDRLSCDHLLTTLGARGMALLQTKDDVWHIPTVAQKVFDVTGAGDTVMAVLALCLSSGLNLLDACVLANYAAGLVVADVGASTVRPDALQGHIAATPKPLVSRW